jgi:membrane protein
MTSVATDQEDWRVHWQAMEEACRRIMTYTLGYTEERFCWDEKTCDAVVRNLELIARAAKGVHADARLQIDRDHWRTVARFSEVVADSVGRDNQETVWRVASEEVPELLEVLESVSIDGEGVRAPAAGAQRGRLAQHPWQIPPKGWRDILLRVWNQLFANNVFIVAAGVAFYGLFSLFPGLATLVSIYGLLFDAGDVREQLNALAGLFPSEAWDVIQTQLTRVVENPRSTLSVSALIGLLVTLWSSRAGIGALMIAMNIVYEEAEKRSVVRWYGLSLLLTVGAIIYVAVAVAVIVALPAALKVFGVDELATVWVSMLRWPMLALSTMVALAVIYRYGPSRRAARWKWVSGGAVVATLLWLAGSVLFSYYVTLMGDFDETYGSVGAVIVLMLWFYVSAFIVLLGAELDAESEHQSRLDTTVGPPRPMGERGAHMADTVGKIP